MRLLLLMLAVACSPDADGDGYRAKKDCNDEDPGIHPGAEELCDGVDSDCDGVDEPDADGDGYRVCAECDDSRADVFPGAPSTCDGADADCDGTISEAEGAAEGEDGQCPSTTCRDLHAARPELTDGTYWMRGFAAPFEVDCDMQTDGGGWAVLALVDDGVLIGSNSPSNPWHKCADDATAPWPWLSAEADVTQDYPGSARVEEYRPWVRPSDGHRYDREAVEAMAAVMTELHGDVKLVASTNDDDGGAWQDGGFSGLEAYAIAADGTWFLLTPGTGGECGGASGWPAADVDGMQYHWSTDASESWWQGTQVEQVELELGALPAQAVLPLGFVLATFTGGGVAVGYDAEVIRVR